MRHLLNYQQAVLAILCVFPLLMAARYFAVAAWATPAGGFIPFDSRPWFTVPYILVGVGCVLWSFNYEKAWAHAYLGSGSALLAMVRCVTLIRGDIPGSSHWVSVVTWGTISLMSLLVTVLGVEFVVVRHRAERILERV